jgi:hypothetical protein
MLEGPYVYELSNCTIPNEIDCPTPNKTAQYQNEIVFFSSEKTFGRNHTDDSVKSLRSFNKYLGMR